MYVCVLSDVYTTASNDHLSTAPTRVKDTFFMKDVKTDSEKRTATQYTHVQCGEVGGSTHCWPPPSLIQYNTISDL